MVSIAIDGPGGAGKSTLAKRMAETLGYLYVDTGALYRTVGLAAVRAGADTKSEEAVAALLPEIQVELAHVNGEQRVFLNGEDVSDAIRTEAGGMAASDVSAHGAVRAFLLETQRRLARQHNVIMDGRDIGTVVLPNATVKVFLTAQPEARARRRWLQLREKGEEADLAQVLRDVETRDYNDSHRAIAPLRPAEDAVLLDTTGDGLEESLARLLAIAAEKTPPEGEKSQ